MAETIKEQVKSEPLSSNLARLNRQHMAVDSIGGVDQCFIITALGSAIFMKSSPTPLC